MAAAAVRSAPSASERGTGAWSASSLTITGLLGALFCIICSTAERPTGPLITAQRHPMPSFPPHWPLSQQQQHQSNETINDNNNSLQTLALVKFCSQQPSSCNSGGRGRVGTGEQQHKQQQHQRQRNLTECATLRSSPNSEGRIVCVPPEWKRTANGLRAANSSSSSSNNNRIISSDLRERPLYFNYDNHRPHQPLNTPHLNYHSTRQQQQQQRRQQTEVARRMLARALKHGTDPVPFSPQSSTAAAALLYMEKLIKSLEKAGDGGAGETSELRGLRGATTSMAGPGENGDGEDENNLAKSGNRDDEQDAGVGGQWKSLNMAAFSGGGVGADEEDWGRSMAPFTTIGAKCSEELTAGGRGEPVAASPQQLDIEHGNPLRPPVKRGCHSAQRAPPTGTGGPRRAWRPSRRTNTFRVSVEQAKRFLQAQHEAEVMEQRQQEDQYNQQKQDSFIGPSAVDHLLLLKASQGPRLTLMAPRESAPLEAAARPAAIELAAASERLMGGAVRLHRSESPNPSLPIASESPAVVAVANGQQLQQSPIALATSNQTLTGILEPESVDEGRKPVQSSEDSAAAVEGGDTAMQCNLRRFKFRAVKRDEKTGNKCYGMVTATVCYGGCDTGEIADWLFPHKKSIHKVCRHGTRFRRRAILDQCNSPDAPQELREYFYIDAGNCVCKKCTSVDTACLDTMSRPNLPTIGETLAVLLD